MAQAPLHDKIVTETVTTLRAHSHNQAATARALGIDRSTLRNRINIAIGRGLYSETENPLRAHHHHVVPRQPFGPGGELHLTPPPAEAGAGETVEELVARKKRALARAQALESHQALIPVAVPDARPIALLLVGDPHVDDDGCDIARLESDLRTVAGTPGFFAGHVGDLTNNWVGRLARLYAAQSTSFNDGLRLTEWMLGLCPNLFLVGGNHDCWNNGMDLLGFITRQAGNTAHVQAHGARLALRWPDGAEMRLHARHDFPGKSQFSDTHGMKRELLWGHRDHILVAGHTHVDEARVEPSLEGQAHWMFRVSGYKILDEYARASHFRAKRLAPSVAVVLDPTRPHAADRVKPFWDAREAADYLTWRRSAPAKRAARPAPRPAANGGPRA